MQLLVTIICRLRLTLTGTLFMNNFINQTIENLVRAVVTTARKIYKTH
jgi:hypothetical protein